jgi:fucose 4-O-acetylase-like acetyltransferase
MTHLKPRLRLDWIDYTKGLGIFLVVLGHTLRGLIGDSSGVHPKEWTYLDSWIYSFHMPLFFFLSGLLSSKMAAKSSQEFISEKIRIIAYPYILWTFVIQSIRVLSGQENTSFVNFIGHFWTTTYQPIGIFWFFYVLLLISLSHFSLMKFSKNTWLTLGFSIGIYCYHILFSGITLWDPFTKASIYSLYFTCGILLANQSSLNKSPTNNMFLAAASILGFTAISIAPSLIHTTTTTTAEPYPLIAISGIIGSISLARILDNLQWLQFLKTWGQLSLQIYVVHTATAAMARILLKKILNIDDLTIHLFIGVFAGIYGAIALNSIALRLNWNYLFTLPKQLSR